MKLINTRLAPLLLTLMLSSSRGFVAITTVRIGCSKLSAASSDVPSPERRQLLNKVVGAAAGLTSLTLATPYVSFFVPPEGSGGGDGSTIARDALGNEVTVASWLATHLPGSRELVEGIKGDATYLTVDDDHKLSGVAINAICTHLGCVVPWNVAEKKFICPCHNSMYDKNGKVERGPAPLSLALSHVVEDKDGKVVLKPWTETDFRSGENPWWSSKK
jgi:cytochrome b6-f complex iron-sulfur subunit